MPRLEADDGLRHRPPKDARLLPLGAPGARRVTPPRLVLKVDVDTLSGTVDGVPRLLDLFAREGVRATFLFSLGPDTTGRAVKRVFRKGFVKKVLRASPAASYGLRTMLYGTLLPAPDIGKRPAAASRMREALAAGHECGLHAWDHVDWHDRLPRMPRGEVLATVARAAARFEELLGARPLVAGAPGWTANALSVEAYEAAGIRVSSDTRGGRPFHPARPDGSPSPIVEVPSTLPTLDELLAEDRFGRDADAREATTGHLLSLVAASAGSAVHSIHTEIEGGRALHALFARQLAAWKEAGIRFPTLREAAEEALAAGSLPCRRLALVTIPNRATPVARQEG
ncbi:MAG: 4-deoxy-4-formamido-L-arabinose-phosphoundecaprenol deformylase [Acidobacteria bacterium]|nr:MAG: 4-deoxy-4-formamido-L-arabinose-phosphoundecaprenol deformylase [Acidobacteriota bacterium]